MLKPITGTAEIEFLARCTLVALPSDRDIASRTFAHQHIFLF